MFKTFITCEPPINSIEKALVLSDYKYLHKKVKKKIEKVLLSKYLLQ